MKVTRKHSHQDKQQIFSLQSKSIDISMVLFVNKCLTIQYPQKRAYNVGYTGIPIQLGLAIGVISMPSVTISEEK